MHPPFYYANSVPALAALLIERAYGTYLRGGIMIPEGILFDAMACELLTTEVASFKSIRYCVFKYSKISFLNFLLPMPAARLLDRSYAGSPERTSIPGMRYAHCRLLRILPAAPTVPRGIKF